MPCSGCLALHGMNPYKTKRSFSGSFSVSNYWQECNYWIISMCNRVVKQSRFYKVKYTMGYKCQLCQLSASCVSLPSTFIILSHLAWFSEFLYLHDPRKWPNPTKWSNTLKQFVGNTIFGGWRFKGYVISLAIRFQLLSVGRDPPWMNSKTKNIA